jgi:hypothetical protein
MRMCIVPNAVSTKYNNKSSYAQCAKYNHNHCTDNRYSAQTRDYLSNISKFAHKTLFILIVRIPTKKNTNKKLE